MTITLKDYAGILPKELLLSAEKNKVRECDETEKGHFAAYVDEGNDSYDVSLNFTGNEVSSHTCDCKNGDTFCRHKTALLMHIAKGKKSKGPVKAKKKENKTDLLLDQTDANELKEWVRNLLQKNKDLELSFIHYFSASQQQYTPDDVRKLVAEGIKVVLGNRKTAEAIQLKKLVELWTEMLKPIIKQYQSNVMDENAFLNFHAMLEGIITYQMKVETTSNKIPKFVEAVLQASAEGINSLQIEESWNQSIRHFINHIFPDTRGFRMHYLLHLKNISEISETERKEKITGALAKQYEQSRPDDMAYGQTYTKIIFTIVEENGCFSRYYHLFKPLQFDNDYNIKLIQSLIKNHHFETAAKFCHHQILSNYKPEYNVPYWELLKEIYSAQNDETNLVNILAELFPFTFDFEDYLFITSRMSEEERKKWRTKMLSRAGNSSNNRNFDALVFVFRLMDHERNYKKMIDYIDSYTPYRIISIYFEAMALAEKSRFIEKLAGKVDEFFFYDPGKEDKDKLCFPELFALTVKHYTTQYLRMIIAKVEKDRNYYRLNRFLVYAKERLMGVE